MRKQKYWDAKILGCATEKYTPKGGGEEKMNFNIFYQQGGQAGTERVSEDIYNKLKNSIGKQVTFTEISVEGQNGYSFVTDVVVKG